MKQQWPSTSLGFKYKRDFYQCKFGKPTATTWVLMMLVRVQQWPPIVILSVNSAVHNSWPTNRQPQARLQAPASGRHTWKEACKSVGRKGKVIRNNRKQKDGAEKLTRMPACKVSAKPWAQSSSAADTCAAV